MISDTEVQRPFHSFGASADTVVMVTGPAALMSVQILSTTGGFNPLVVIYDSSTTGGATSSTEVTTFFAGFRGTHVSNGLWLKVPGNGIRFNDGIVAKVATTDLQFVTLIYQGGV